MLSGYDVKDEEEVEEEDDEEQWSVSCWLCLGLLKVAVPHYVAWEYRKQKRRLTIQFYVSSGISWRKVH